MQGLNKCFKNLDNPTDLFSDWFLRAKKTEINDPNAVSLATANKKAIPSVRMVLMKSYSKRGFVFYTNLNSQKSNEIKKNPQASMCFHWKSLLRQIRITGKIKKISKQESDKYFESRGYDSKIGAWASKQSSRLTSLSQLHKEINKYKKKYPKKNYVPRPNHWSGWILVPNEIEFWLDGDNRIHQRLKYKKEKKNKWKKFLISP